MASYFEVTKFAKEWVQPRSNFYSIQIEDVEPFIGFVHITLVYKRTGAKLRKEICLREQTETTIGWLLDSMEKELIDKVNEINRTNAVLYERFVNDFFTVVPRTYTLPSIKDVIFNDPATIVFWHDGFKTVVKCQEGDTFDPEKGLAMAIAKRVYGNKGNYNNRFKKWLPKEEE